MELEAWNRHWDAGHALEKICAAVRKDSVELRIKGFIAGICSEGRIR